MKPILFNTEMVRAILDGRKTTTRRVIKPQCKRNFIGTDFRGHPMECRPIDVEVQEIVQHPKLPYQPGDILYVRETWRIHNVGGDFDANTRWAEIEFKAGGRDSMLWRIQPDFEKWCKGARWNPSLFMPKETARIFLRVTDVKAERLQDITENGIVKEGISPFDDRCADENWHPTFYDPDSGGTPQLKQGFEILWDSTVKKSDRDKYGWEANPWVWVISFERMARPDEK